MLHMSIIKRKKTTTDLQTAFNDIFVQVEKVFGIELSWEHLHLIVSLQIQKDVEDYINARIQDWATEDKVVLLELVQQKLEKNGKNQQTDLIKTTRKTRKKEPLN